MKYDNKLLDIVKNKKFKTFWHCVDYLLLAGYTVIEAFGVAIQEFGYDKVFQDVAFVRYWSSDKNSNVIQTVDGSYTFERPIDPFTGMIITSDFHSELTLGLIDDTNIHLNGLYSVYRKWLAQGKIDRPQPEIENTCSVINIKNLTPFIIEFLKDSSLMQFGYDVIVDGKPPHNPPAGPNIGDLQRQMLRRTPNFRDIR